MARIAHRVFRPRMLFIPSTVVGGKEEEEEKETKGGERGGSHLKMDNLRGLVIASGNRDLEHFFSSFFAPEWLVLNGVNKAR